MFQEGQTRHLERNSMKEEGMKLHGGGRGEGKYHHTLSQQLLGGFVPKDVYFCMSVHVCVCVCVCVIFLFSAKGHTMVCLVYCLFVRELSLQEVVEHAEAPLIELIRHLERGD